VSDRDAELYATESAIREGYAAEGESVPPEVLLAEKDDESGDAVVELGDEGEPGETGA